MTKYDFEDWLRHRLSDLPPEELDRIAAFYRDAIDDRMEEGMTEEEAIYDLGEPETLLEDIRASLPPPQTYRPVHQNTKKTMSTRKWITAGLISAVLGVALPVLLLMLFNASPRYETVYEEVTPPMVDEAVLDYSSSYSFDAGTLEKISVDAAFGSVQVEPSEDGTVYIVGDANLFEATRRGSTLYVENVNADIILMLPMDMALRLSVQCDMGDVVLYEICPQALNISCDLGSIFLHNVSALDSITLEADCGNIEGSLKGMEADYEIDVTVDLGETNLSDSYHSGDEEIQLTATADLGSILLTFEE